MQHYCLKEVRKVSKKAKTFELQKAVKKLRGLRCVGPRRYVSHLSSARAKAETSDAVAGVENELEIIKVNDVDGFRRLIY